MTNKRIILVGINAKYIHSNPAVYSLKTYADTYYGDCSVFDGNSKITDNLTISEYTINQSLDSILADLYNQKPDVVAFSCYIWNWSMVRDILDELPKIMPKTDIWLGGPEVSFNADKLVNQYPAIKGIMVGEGEETFLELLKYYWEAADRFQNLSDIKGIVLKEGFTGERELTNIDKLPFIYNNNTDFTDKFKNRIIYYESQRGCPFRCSYCLSSIDKSVRLRDLETVKKELKFFLDNKVDQVKFIDRTFNCNNEHALSIWRFLKENDNGITNFHFEIAADLLSTQQLEIISQMRPGLIQLEIGVQSTNEKTLKAINRHMDIEQLKSTVQKVHGYKNTHQHLDLIAGLPYEDYNSFASSFNEVYKMQPNQLQLGFLKVLNGSPMKEKAEEYGIVYSSKPPYEVLYTNWLSYDDVLKLKGIEEMVELYYNSGQFSHTVPVLVNEFGTPFEMFEALAGYYQDNGYFINTPSRVYRYNVLLEFALKTAPEKDRLFRQLLTYDIYLRENMKSRPDFCQAHFTSNKADGISLKNSVRNFYIEEENSPHFLKGYEGYQSIQLAKMTHIEAFDFPVWEETPDKCNEPLKKPAYILFDYKNRNVLNHDASTFIIEF